MSSREGEEVRRTSEEDEELESESSSSKDSKKDPVAKKIQEVDPNKEHRFWDKQPVPRLTEVPDNVGEIQAAVPVDEVPNDPLRLPSAFEWYAADVDDEAELEELYVLLRDNYVEDDDAMFRFDYQKDFLLWALKPPGWCREWHLAVRVKDTRQLVGFISAVPAIIRTYEQEREMVEINFLCVHKQLRSKRLAPVLIAEVTRRVHLRNIWQAVYTAGIVLPRPVASCRYFHRSLNPKKLIKIKFSSVPYKFRRAKKPLDMVEKYYALPDETDIPGFREFTEQDVPEVTSLLNKHLEKFSLHAIFSEEEVAHWLLPRIHVVSSYVVQDPDTGRITDFASFYSLPSSVLKDDEFDRLDAAYAYYNVATSVSTPQLIHALLIKAKQLGYDVFNALNFLGNEEWLEELLFGPGDGTLQFYMYNFKCPPMEPGQVGLVLV